MSKIFDAYKKKVGHSPDLALEIGKAGTVSLYPTPEGKQQGDFNKLANRLLGLRNSWTRATPRQRFAYAFFAVLTLAFFFFNGPVLELEQQLVEGMQP